MQKQIRWFVIGDLLFVGLMILLGQLLLSLGVDPAVAVLPTMALGSIALVVLLSVFIRYQRSQPTIRRITAGEHWVHWHYAPGEWRTFATSDTIRAYNNVEEITIPALARNVIIYTISAGAAGFFIGMFGHSRWQSFQMALVMGGVVLIVSILFAIKSYRENNRPPSDEAVDVYIGPLGIYLPERFISFNDPHTTLADVQVVPGSPGILVFETRFSTNYHRAILQKLAIPIPSDQAAEAEAISLAERFCAEMVIRIP